MCNCSGECCVCALGGSGCLAGNGDDDFIPAKKEKIIERLDNNEYERYREYMIKYLKEKYGLDYIQNKESEDNSMLHNVTVTKTEEKVLEEYYVMRAVKNSNFAPNKTKQVFKEKECNQQPTLEEIAQFLSDTGADFVSVEHNYRFEPDLPFC